MARQSSENTPAQSPKGETPAAGQAEAPQQKAASTAKKPAAKKAAPTKGAAAKSAAAKKPRSTAKQGSSKAAAAATKAAPKAASEASAASVPITAAATAPKAAAKKPTSTKSSGQGAAKKPRAKDAAAAASKGSAETTAPRSAVTPEAVPADAPVKDAPTSTAAAKPARKPRTASAKAQPPATGGKAATKQEADAETPEGTSAKAAEPAVAEPIAVAPIAPAADESETAHPANTTSTVPVIPVQPGAYGQVKPIQKKRSRKGAIAAVAVIAAVVIAAIVAAPRIIDAMSPAQMLPSTSGPVTVLTTSRVSDDLNNMDIPMPDLGNYSYILTDDLIGPRFSIPDIEDMLQTVSGASPSYSQKITTKATYNNKGIRIVVPISVVYTYDETGQTWIAGEPELGTPETEPLSAASYEAVLADIDLVVRSYSDENYKTLFKAAEVTSQTNDLTKDGGTITASLFAQTETQTATSTATIQLAWDNVKGWVATISEVTAPEVTERDIKQEILAKEEEEAAQKEEEEYANEERPQYHIECTSSDVVEFNGKMSRAGNGYLLTLNDPLRLTLDGKLCYVHTVALTFGEYEDYSVYKPEDIDPAELVGSNQGFAGTLSLTDAGSQALTDAASKNRDHASEKGAPLVTMRVIEA